MNKKNDYIMQIYSESNTKNKYCNIISSVIICFSLINATVGIPGVSILTIGIVFLLFFIALLKNEITIYSVSILIILHISIVFVISFIFMSDNEYTFTYLSHFFLFDIIAFFAGMQRINTEKVFSYIKIIGMICVTLIVVRGIDNINYSSKNSSGIMMGICYSFVPIILSSIMSLRCKISKLSFLISFYNIILVGYVFVNHAPRGVLLSLIMYFVLFYFFYDNSKKCFLPKHFKQIVFLLFIMFSVCFVLNNLQVVLFYVNDIFENVTGNRIYALDKFSFLNKIGNASNGRDRIIDAAIDIIHNSWTLGNGIGYFESVTGEGYTHNILLQVFCEAGVFFAIPLLLLFSISFIVIIRYSKNRSNNVFSFYLMICITGFFILLYSSVYWKLLMFWFGIGATLKYYYNDFKN